MITKLSKTYTQALLHIVDVVKTRQIDLNVRHIIIVPDKYTLEMERLVYQNTSGAIDCDVLTFNRLLHQIEIESNIVSLSKKASIMLIKKLCQNCKFAAFKKSAKFAGFGERMYDTIQMLKSCRITHQDLIRKCNDELYEGLKVKLHDIATIYSDYMDACRGRFVDGGDRFELLNKAIMSGGIVTNCHIYIVNFDAFTPVMSCIIESMDKKALSLNISTIDSMKHAKWNLDKLSIYQAYDEVDELKAIAKRIKVDIIKGLRYKDIGVVYNSNPSLLRRIFAEYDINVNIDIPYHLDSFPLAVWIVILLDICSDNAYKKDNMISLAKNYFSRLKNIEIIAFCNYVNKYAIDYNAFKKEFDDQLAEQVRIKIIKSTEYFKDSVYNANNALEFCNNMDVYLTSLQGVVNGLNDITDLDANQIANKIKLLVEDLMLVVDCNDSTNLGISCFVESLKTKISILPPLYDAVNVGGCESLRGIKKSKIYICGLNEGVLPNVQYDCGIITDGEIESISKIGLMLSPTIKDVNTRSKIELKQIVYSGAEIVCSYIYNNEKKPAYILESFKSSATQVLESSFELEMQIMNETDNLVGTNSQKLAELQLLHIGTDNSALELLLKVQLKDNALNSAIYYALCNRGIDVEKYISSKDIEPLYRARELFFDKKTISISRIEKYYTCAFWHFLQYGLRIKPQEMGSAEPNDLGSFLHKVLEMFVQQQLRVDKIDDIVNQVLEQREFYKLQLEANHLIKQRAIKEVKKVCYIIVEQLKESDFVPCGVEIKFGVNKDIEGLVFDDITLEGIIDRIDKYGKYIRLIDYKSGNIKFSYADVFFGKKLQLVSYIKVLLKRGDSIAGGFYFPIRDTWDDDDFSHRLKGLYNRDMKIVTHLDKTLVNPKKSSMIDATTKLTKNNVFSLVSNKSAITEEQILGISNYGVQMIEQAITQIRKGNINTSPILENGNEACSYCPYSTICISKDSDIITRLIRSVNLQQFVDVED